MCLYLRRNQRACDIRSLNYFNNRARATRPVAVLTTHTGTVIQNGMVRPSFIGTLEIRTDVPFSQMELNNLPTDVATLMFRVLGGNPEHEEFIVKITSPNSADSAEKDNNLISESWMGGGVINSKHYSIFTGEISHYALRVETID